MKQSTELELLVGKAISTIRGQNWSDTPLTEGELACIDMAVTWTTNQYGMLPDEAKKCLSDEEVDLLREMGESHAEFGNQEGFVLIKLLDWHDRHK